MRTFYLYFLIGIFMLLSKGVMAQVDTTFYVATIDSLNNVLIVQKATISNQQATIKSNQKFIDQLQSKVTYLKDALDLHSSTLKTDYNNISININSITGIKSQNKIVIEGLMENHGVVDKFQTKNMQLVDPKGNSYKSYSISYGGEKSLQRFERNIPIKIKIEFSDIVEYAPAYKALILNIYDNKYPGRSNTVIFKNLEVNWQ